MIQKRRIIPDVDAEPVGVLFKGVRGESLFGDQSVVFCEVCGEFRPCVQLVEAVGVAEPFIRDNQDGGGIAMGEIPEL